MHGPVLYQVLHELGIVDDQAPARLRELRTGGQKTPGELIDRYQIEYRPIRDLLVDYLRERQPGLDYYSLGPWPTTWANGSGKTSSCTTGASAACTCPPRSPAPGGNAC